MDKTILHWSYRDYHHIPIELFLYEELEEIYLKENFITQIPKWFINMTYLKFIHISGNSLTELPEDICNMENLEFLDVSHNKIVYLPQTIGHIKTLQRLNVSGNLLTEIPKNIGHLKQLKHLDISCNQLQSLPIEMSECSGLNELLMSDNDNLTYLPERIATMKSLQILEADRCGLLYLPAALAKFLNIVQVFQNSAITHIPLIYEKFFINFYDTVQTATSRLDDNTHLFVVREKETNSKLILPTGTINISAVPLKKNIITLYNDCLHALNHINLYLPIYKSTELNSLPTKYMKGHIRNGPIARCTYKNCLKALYTSYSFMPVKRKNSTSKVIFSCFFCSIFCANSWLIENSKKYYSIEWEYCYH